MVFIETELFVSGCLEMCLKEKSDCRDLCRTNDCEMLIIYSLSGLILFIEPTATTR